MPRVADNWVFPNFGCSRYLAGFSTLRDICQHTQLVTPKSMRRMAVPAKAAMALRMLVPRLLLTCGRERGTKTKSRKDRSSSSPPSLLHPPFHGPGVGVMSPVRLDFSLTLLSLLLPWDPRKSPSCLPLLLLSSWELLGRRPDPLQSFPGPGLQQMALPPRPAPSNAILHFPQAQAQTLRHHGDCFGGPFLHRLPLNVCEDFICRPWVAFCKCPIPSFCIWMSKFLPWALRKTP